MQDQSTADLVSGESRWLCPQWGPAASSSHCRKSNKGAKVIPLTPLMKSDPGDLRTCHPKALSLTAAALGFSFTMAFGNTGTTKPKKCLGGSQQALLLAFCCCVCNCYSSNHFHWTGIGAF